VEEHVLKHQIKQSLFSHNFICQWLQPPLHC